MSFFPQKYELNYNKTIKYKLFFSLCFILLDTDCQDTESGMDRNFNFSFGPGQARDEIFNFTLDQEGQEKIRSVKTSSTHSTFSVTALQ